jgi:hypothetical protein
MVSWDPSLYARFAVERARPFEDLASRVRAVDPRRVVDGPTPRLSGSTPQPPCSRSLRSTPNGPT